MVWVGGLGFESGYPSVTMPFVFVDPIGKSESKPPGPKPPIIHWLNDALIKEDPSVVFSISFDLVD